MQIFPYLKEILYLFQSRLDSWKILRSFNILIDARYAKWNLFRIDRKSQTIKVNDGRTSLVKTRMKRHDKRVQYAKKDAAAPTHGIHIK